MSTKSLSPAEMANAVETATNTTDTTVTTNEETAGTDSSKPAQAIKLATARTGSNPDVEQLNSLVDQFNMIRSRVSKVTINGQREELARASIKAFGSLINHVFNHQDDIQVLEAFRKAVASNRGKTMSCEEALQGMNYVASDMLRNRFSIMYMLMFELTNPERKHSNFDYLYASKVCTNPSCSSPNGYISYIESRMR